MLSWFIFVNKNSQLNADKITLSVDCVCVIATAPYLTHSSRTEKSLRIVSFGWSQILPGEKSIYDGYSESNENVDQPM